MSQGSLNPKIRFLGQKAFSVARIKTDRYNHKMGKNDHKMVKNENFEKQKNAFLSCVPRIPQPKN